MGLYEQFPYTNLHELNLDWIINEIKKLGEAISQTDFAIKYADPFQWDINTAYDKYTLVQSGYFYYLSMRDVPAGIDIADTSYWLEVADFDNALEGMAADICTNQFDSHNAVRAYQAGDIFWMDLRLYRAKVNIAAGYPITTSGPLANAEPYVFLDYIKGLLQDLTDEVDGALSTLAQFENNTYLQDNELYEVEGLSYMDGYITSGSAAWVIFVPIAKKMDNVSTVSFEGTCTGTGRLATGGNIEASSLEISAYVDSVSLIKSQNTVRLVLRKTGGWQSGGSTVTNNASASFQISGTSSLKLRFSE